LPDQKSFECQRDRDREREMETERNGDRDGEKEQKEREKKRRSERERGWLGKPEIERQEGGGNKFVPCYTQD